MSSNNSCETCACDKKKKIENFGGNKEYFSYEAPKNMCHYACSSINTTNILLFVLILVLLYLLSREKFNFKFLNRNKN
jgi:hypothetical protein